MRIRFLSLILTVVMISGVIFAGAGEVKPAKGFYLEKAKQAADWLMVISAKQPDGIAWKPAPYAVESPLDYTLYHGSPGVILFFLELYYSTDEKRYLDIACRAADHLLNQIPNEKYTGLYTGLSGVGFVLDEVYRASKKDKYRAGVLQCIAALRQKAEKKGKGVQWNIATEIVYGGAGTGLFLLHMAKKYKDPGLVKLAVQAGKRLIELAIPDKGGLKWNMTPKASKLMPNFSHGTSGVAYFLATLHRHTGQKEFLDAALAGVRYLLALAEENRDSCLVFHHEPEGEDLYYLGWCHGPPGTANLFYRLYQITGDKSWLDWIRQSAGEIMASGIPGKQTPGFWNNVGRCCGNAGVAEFFLDLHRHLPQENNKNAYLEFSKKMTRDIIKKALPAGKVKGMGLKWVHAEHRKKPEFLQSQTGLMQGSAGIGLWFLKLDAYEKGKKPRIRFPDSPF